MLLIYFGYALIDRQFCYDADFEVSFLLNSASLSLKHPDQNGITDESCAASTEQSFPKPEPVMHG